MARSKKVRNLVELYKQHRRAKTTERKLENKVQEGYASLSVPEKAEFNQHLKEDAIERYCKESEDE